MLAGIVALANQPHPSRRRSVLPGGLRGPPRGTQDLIQTKAKHLEINELLSGRAMRKTRASNVGRGRATRSRVYPRPGIPGNRAREPTLGDLIFIFYLCILRLPKSQCAPEWALDLISGNDFERNLSHFSTRIRSRDFRGPPWPRRSEHRPTKSGAGFLF